MKNLNTTKKEFKIPVPGTLGILALGARGVRAWRKVREEYHRQNPKPQTDEEK